jgi:hypothetical protein
MKKLKKCIGHTFVEASRYSNQVVKESKCYFRQMTEFPYQELLLLERHVYRNM